MTTSVKSASSTPDPRAAAAGYASRLAEIQQEQQQAEERASVVRQLDVLAGLMGCFAAMDDRPRRYADPPVRVFEQTNAVSEYWRKVA